MGGGGGGGGGVKFAAHRDGHCDNAKSHGVRGNAFSSCACSEKGQSGADTIARRDASDVRSWRESKRSLYLILAC